MFGPRKVSGQYLKHLRDVYKVDEALDDVRLYFHFPNMIDSATSHIHVRVNQKVHPLEQYRSIVLDDVIAHLERGISVRQLILMRGPWYTKLGDWDEGYVQPAGAEVTGQKHADGGSFLATPAAESPDHCGFYGFREGIMASYKVDNMFVDAQERILRVEENVFKGC